jgi:hypothetical protein
MKKKPMTLVGISKYTAEKDWGGDSEGWPVIPDSVMNEAEILLQCTLKGEPRRPPPPGDFDVDTTCRCGAAIVKRNSAPAHAIALCPQCWYEESKR